MSSSARPDLWALGRYKSLGAKEPAVVPYRIAKKR